MYTRTIMKRIIASWPLPPRTKESKHAAWAVAGVFTVMVVAQLFSLEKFIPLLESYDFSGTETGGVLAVLLVAFSVGSLPFLLQMKLSVAMRWLSMIAGWIIIGLWLFLAIWMNVTDLQIENAGLLGASVALLPGWWVLCVVLGLGILVGWASWGLWPGRTKIKTKKK